MHIYTIIRVKAETPQEAIETVNGRVANYEYTPSPFDSVVIEHTKVHDDFSEADFERLINDERGEYERYMQMASESADECLKGYYTRKAGECLQHDDLESMERLAYDLDKYEERNPSPTARVFFVEIDRHF